MRCLRGRFPAPISPQSPDPDFQFPNFLRDLAGDWFELSGARFDVAVRCCSKIAADEVRHLTEIVRIYSRRFVFCRREAPTIIPAFTAGEHRQLHRDKDEFLQALSFASGEIPQPSFPLAGGWLDQPVAGS